MNSSLLIGIVDHLWQSTLFVALAGCLTLFVRSNSARVRCFIWLAASIKFLFPFALLTALGSEISWPSASLQGTVPGFMAIAAQTAVQVTQISAERLTKLAQAAQDENHGAVLLIALEVVWAVGMLAVSIRWFHRWRVLRRALRESTPGGLPFAVPVRSSSSHFEPAVVGILRPVLLLPQGMQMRLSPAELAAVLAHEQCHVAWRDNLAASLHMLVEALFWFHPLVWWLGSRIIDERERACDERVLAQGHPAHSYAEGILKICEFYLQSPIASAAGVGGANLTQRIEAIMKNGLVKQLGTFRKLALTVAAAATIAVPLAIGILAAPRGNAAAADDETELMLHNVSIRLAPAQEPQGPALYNSLGLMTNHAMNVKIAYNTLRDFIAAAYGVDASQVVGKDLSQIPLFQITADNPWPENPTDSGEVRSNRLRKSLGELAMLQRQLLATHFGLVVKRERRQMDGYVLSVSAGGSKLVPDSDAPWWKQGTGLSKVEVITTQEPVAIIPKVLEGMFLKPVLDQTGLTGTYDYKLTWTAAAPGQMPDPAMMAKALEEQLGLHLEAKTVTVDVINVLSIKAPDQIVTAR